MSKKLFVWYLPVELLNGIYKNDARNLRILVPCDAAFPNYVWAETEAEASILATEWAKNKIKEVTDFEFSFKAPKDQIINDLPPACIIGESLQVESIEPRDKLAEQMDSFFGKDYFVSFIPKTKKVGPSSVINYENEGEVIEVSQEEVANMVRSTFQLVN